MLDIQFIRDNPKLVAEKSEQKGYKVNIGHLLELDTERRTRLTQVEELRSRRNAQAASLKQGRPSPEQITAGKQLKEEISALEIELNGMDSEFQALMWTIPNIAKDDVPIGDESASVEVARVGEQVTGAEDHLDFALRRGWVDFERGTKVAGPKFYYLKGDLALLENAITQFALNFITAKDFTYMTVPNMVNGRIATGTGFAPRSSEQSDEYFIEGEDLSLIATAEIPLTGYHADEIIDEADLPLLYAGYSPCYRKEAGTYGKHTRGLFRVHQFNKLEMYAFTLPEDSETMHEHIRAIEEELWQAIGIPYHVINIASGDLGAPAAKKYDIEYWSKVDGAYRELTSCSNCTDFQTRNLNIRVRRKDGTIEMLHSLNGTAVSLARSLVVILEHFQNDDGTLQIPNVLRPYMGGRERI
jgi:seryl-tRNA synthetase